MLRCRLPRTWTFSPSNLVAIRWTYCLSSGSSMRVCGSSDVCFKFPVWRLQYQGFNQIGLLGIATTEIHSTKKSRRVWSKLKIKELSPLSNRSHPYRPYTMLKRFSISWRGAMRQIVRRRLRVCMWVSAEKNYNVQAVEYHGSIGRLSFLF